LGFSIGDEAWVLAKDVFCASKRPDISTKFEMASSFIRLGFFPDDSAARYKEEIFALNGFFEDAPRKIGYQAFEDHFISLIVDLEKNSYSPSGAPVPVTTNLEALNGAHRVAAASALGQHIRIQVIDQRPSFDFNFFRGRVSERTLDLAALTYIRECQDVRALILHASLPPENEQMVTDELQGLWDPIFSKAVEADQNLYLNIKKLNYLNPRELSSSYWAGCPENNFAGLRNHVRKSSGPYGIRVVFFRPRGSTDQLNQAKKTSRENLGGNRHFIHTTDSHLETFMIASAILHEESLLALKNRPASWSTPLDQVIASYRQKSALDVPFSSEILFGGSVSLDGHGIRKCNDVDMLTDSSSDFTRLRSLFGDSNFLDENLSDENSYSGSSASMSSDFSAHFYVNGMKVVSLRRLEAMKQIRSRGANDKLDLLLIMKYMSRNSSTKRSGGFRDTLRWAAASSLSGNLRAAYGLYLRIFIFALPLLSKLKAKLMRRRA